MNYLINHSFIQSHIFHISNPFSPITEYILNKMTPSWTNLQRPISSTKSKEKRTSSGNIPELIFRAFSVTKNVIVSIYWKKIFIMISLQLYIFQKIILKYIQFMLYHLSYLGLWFSLKQDAQNNMTKEKKTWQPKIKIYYWTVFRICLRVCLFYYHEKKINRGN